MSGERRSRRAKSKAIDYAKEQEFSDGDLFEDSPAEEPERKRGRPKGSSRKSKRSSAAARVDEQEAMVVDGVYVPAKPIYTEKGYDPTTPPIRERFPFLPEYEPDGSPRIDLIVGRRPIDEKGADEDDGDSNNSDDDNHVDPSSDDVDDDDDDESDTAGGGRRKRRSSKPRNNKKKASSPTKSKSDKRQVEYEYLVKYKGRSYLHLEWKTGADLESMNKSAKTLYRRWLKKLAQGHDDEFEDPEFDPSYALPQKICAESEQEITLELSDKELMEWEKKRLKELAEEEEDSENENPEAEKKTDGENDEGKDVKKEEDVKTEEPKENTEEKKGMSVFVLGFALYTLPSYGTLIPYYIYYHT